MLQVGDKFPDFFLRDQNGKERTRDDLFDFFTVLFFYIKDDSPACIKEACDFGRMLKDIASRQVQVIGVSSDCPLLHKKMCEANRLQFHLLADEEKTLCKKCGLLKEKEVLGTKILACERTTFILDKTGSILWLEHPAILENHINRTRDALKKFLN